MGTDSLDFKMNSMIPSLVVLIISMVSCTLAINVPKGPGRLFFARALGPQPRRQYFNGMRPNGVTSANKLRVIYRGKNLNELTCRVICIDKDPVPTTSPGSV